MKKFLKILPNFVLIFLRVVKSKIDAYMIQNSIRGTKEDYLNLYKETINTKYPEIESFLADKEKDDGFINELALTTQIVIKGSALNFQHGRLIYALLVAYIRNNQSINNLVLLDIGTARGFSSIIMSRACINKNIESEIHTIDILPHNKKMYWNCINDVKFGKQSRKQLLSEYNNYTKKIFFHTGKSKKIINRLSLDRIHFSFIDGSHDYEDVKFEYLFISSKQIKGDLILFDDVTDGVFDGIFKLINEIEDSKIYSIVRINSSKKRGYAIAKKLI